MLEVVTIAATKTISNYANHITHTPKEAFMADRRSGGPPAQTQGMAA